MPYKIFVTVPTLYSIWFVGDSVIDSEMTETNGGSTVLNRSKKRQSKPNVGVAWGKLLSQSSKVIFLKLSCNSKFLTPLLVFIKTRVND